jgi:hypothetical protein
MVKNNNNQLKATSFQYRLQNPKYYQLYQNLLFSIQTLQTKIYIVLPYKELPVIMLESDIYDNSYPARQR